MDRNVQDAKTAGMQEKQKNENNKNSWKDWRNR